MSSFAIMSLGCKVNNYESASYREGLIQAGFIELSFHEIADIYLINTCALTNVAAAKSKKMINRAHRLNPEAFICVVSCLVECYPEELKKLPIDLMIGNSGKKDLVEIIKANYNKKQPLIIPQKTTELQFEELPVSDYDQTRAFLKIQDGCAQNCSYCIIPQARGRERSLKIEKAIKAAEVLSLRHKEIVLTGIHTGRYGNDIDCDLKSLIKELLKLPKLERLRLSSIEITEIDDELTKIIKENTKLARHLHIPLQSGADKILQEMNRPYTSEEYLKRINRIREAVPAISISTDIIVGFPGESHKDWEASKAFIDKCDFSFLHIFPYSARINTTASSMGNKVDDVTKKDRVKELLDHSRQQFQKYQSKFIDKELSILIETNKDNESFGHSSEYIPVFIPGEYPINTLIKVWGVKTGPKGLSAEVRE